jgi:amino acid transporter
VFAALATEVYLIMYVLMFVAAINLRRREPEHPRGYRAPALLAICVVGTLAAATACVVGLLPPSQLGRITTLPYLLALLAATLLVGLLPPLLLHKLRRTDWKTAA